MKNKPAIITPRIIGGKVRGLRLKGVPGDITRPITDRVKEALFNIIGQDIVDVSFLDCFGGTGSVGIEALSRGASFVRFIDLHNDAANAIRQNLVLSHFEKQAEVLVMDTFRYLQKKPDRTFEYVYIAPPQYHELWIRALQLLDENPAWINEDSWVIVQINPKEYTDLDLAHLKVFEERKYGNTLLLFYQLSE